MKKIVLIIFLILFLTGCTRYVEVPVVEIVTETVTETIIETVIETVEDTEKIEELENKVQQYRDLIGNLGEYLSYVYLMEVSNDNYSSEGIGFSIEYQDKFYLITAGHGVHYVYEDYNVLYTNFKFKSDSGWGYLELLDYDNNYLGRKDYAILVSSQLDDGFNVDLDEDKPLFLIGGDELISDYRRTSIEGESGSPVIDIDGEVTEIATTDIYSYNTDISIILEAIDKLK